MIAANQQRREEPTAAPARPSYDQLVGTIEQAAQSFHELGTVLRAFGARNSGHAAARLEQAMREVVARARR